ncbi:hypothetical protein CIG75_11085 [Tumebacillus algifaecis]|uniref:DUF58 domain-containing protein n=1 Tax=Tumebacillus algifaecis TaxID=1214604 RepID=A0A223D278_9BACL|nr:DUF58 domain-containing protein [Tumebacillus algifaecis]ASS75466.1 hypothetical protein CIG75_11085 [Tumebacillus algifaecis]
MSKGFLTPAFLARLERLRLQVRDMPSHRGGARRSKQLGSSVEFAEYRPYLPGDDLRHLDWRAYARLGRLFLKTFFDERDVLLYLMVDASRSMDFHGKLLQAQRLAAAIGYLGLAEEDRVEALIFADRVRGKLERLMSKQSAHRLFAMLQQAKALGEGTEGSLQWLVRSAMPTEPGVVVILSDFLFADGYEDALKRLQAAQHQVVVIQILSAEELDPSYAGDLQLVDSESGKGLDVALSPFVLKRYRDTVTAYTAELGEFCRRRGMYHVLVPAEESLEAALFGRLLRTGVIGR